jgi:hypothetical protein
MSTEDSQVKDERTAHRLPFDASVEVGGSLGPSFEATAVNVSKDGMQLRTAYLPEIGQPVACRFEAGTAGSVLASGEVVWKQETGDTGGEFGIKFTDLDTRSAEALERIVGLAGKMPIKQESGSRVRLHIDGLGSPMRARIRDSKRSEVTVGSDLGFLQVGKMLELEDSVSGEKRPAHIDRVEVEVDPESHIPRLVVALRYDDVSPSVKVSISPPPAIIEPQAADTTEPESEAAPVEKPAAAAPQPERMEVPTSGPMSVISAGAAKAMPMLRGAATRARTALALFAAKRFRKRDEAPAPRRTTAPPPGGALQASGRKVIRAKEALEEPPKKFPLDKKRMAAGVAVGLAAVVAYAAFAHKSAPHASAPAPAADSAQATAPIDPAASSMVANAGLPPLLPANASPPVFVAPQPAAPIADAKHPSKVAPFGNPNVTHGTVLRLKMDGTIDRINGASEPTGFLVSIPGHKSVEPAGPLASRDGRIASIKVSNDQGGAELSVSFKDGVPPYQVRAKGDQLEIVLAAAGALPGKIDDKKPADKKPNHDPVAHHAKDKDSKKKH